VAPPSPSTPRIKRRPSSRRPRAGSQVQIAPRDAHREALQSIRTFLKSKSCYDVLPLSFKVTVLDTKLDVKKALQCLVTNGKLLCEVYLQSQCNMSIQQGLFQRVFGTASNIVSQASSQSPILSISWLTTTRSLFLMMLPRRM
jgi:hypothetical protein